MGHRGKLHSLTNVLGKKKSGKWLIPVDKLSIIKDFHQKNMEKSCLISIHPNQKKTEVKTMTD